MASLLTLCIYLFLLFFKSEFSCTCGGGDRSKCLNACNIADGSSVNDGDCLCGSINCNAATGRFCLASYHKCLPLCANIDGSSANSNDCRCGTSTCSASTDGLYCNLAENKCGGKCFTGSTFDLSIFVLETQTSKLSPGCKFSTIGTVADWCVDIEADRLKVGAHTLTGSSCSFTSAMYIPTGTVLKLTGDLSVPTVLSGMKTTQFFVVNGQLTLDNLKCTSMVN